MLLVDGLAMREVEFRFPGSLISTFLELMHLQGEAYTLYSDPLYPNTLNPESEREQARGRSGEWERGRRRQRGIERERERVRERAGERERE